MIIYLMTDLKAIEKKIGGGPSFVRNFCKIIKSMGHEYTRCGSGQNWDVGFCPGATMTTREDWEMAKLRQRAFKKPLILRVDGIPEDWRNRGTGWSRLRDYAKEANEVIYQSCFIRDTVGKLLRRPEGKVIYNGIDTKVFTPKGDKFPKFGNPSILHINYRKDPNKRWDEVITRFRYFKLKHPGAAITFVGNYPSDIVQYNFGLGMYERNKDWQYLPATANREELAKIMRSADFFAYPSFADPMPNVLIEALSCGLKPVWINDYGGQKEIVDNWDKIDWSKERMVKDYLELFEGAIKK